MSLRLQPLEEQLEAVEAGLAHPEQRVGAARLTEVRSPVAGAGAEDVHLAEHVLDHEVLALLRQREGERVVGRERQRERKKEGRCEKPPRLLCRVCVRGKSRTRRRRNGEKERRQTAKQSPCCPINKSHWLTGLSPFRHCLLLKGCGYPAFQLFILHARLHP